MSAGKIRENIENRNLLKCFKFYYPWGGHILGTPRPKLHFRVGLPISVFKTFALSNPTKTLKLGEGGRADLMQVII